MSEKSAHLEMLERSEELETSSLIRSEALVSSILVKIGDCDMLE